MKKWRMTVGVAVVAAVALSAIFLNLGAKQPGTTTGSGAAAVDGNSDSKSVTSNVPQPGYPAPDFTLNDMQGKPVKLSGYKGKPVLLNFWASWCPPCKAEMPDLVKKSDKYKEQIVFLGINTAERDDNSPAPAQFISDFHVTYPNLSDTAAAVAKQYQVLGIPTTITVDRHGKIIDRITGGMNETQMETIMQKLISD